MSDYQEKERLVEIKRLEYVKRTEELAKLINAIPICPYAVDVDFEDVEPTLERYDKRDGGLHINPDFQRGHVWTEDQQIAYIENIIRGAVGDSGRTITFSCSDFMRQRKSDSDVVGFYVIDGLQRLTAVRKFMKDEFKVFKHIDGGVYKDFFKNSGFRISGIKGLSFNVHNMQYKKDILQYYLAINGGGTIHSKDELDRVYQMWSELQ